MRQTVKMRNLHSLALEQFDDAYIAGQDDRMLAQVSRRFVMVRGEQWSWDANDDFRNKIKMEIDLVSGAVTRIINEWRKNRISARFLPKDGSSSDVLADACAGRYRADTQDSSGREARATAFDCSVNGGFGGIRLRTEIEDGKTNQQRIALEPINDPETCLYFDVNAKRKDKSDSEHAFLITPWSKRAFEKKYGSDCSSWPAELQNKFRYMWFGDNNDVVNVAEYFVKEKYTQRVRVFKGFKDEMYEEDADDITEEKIEELLATGYVEQPEEKREVDRVAKYVMNGAKILSGPETIAGPNIPLVPQYGHRTVIKHNERFRGHVAKAMDAQIIYNLQISKVAETAASSGVEKPIFTPQQIGRHAQMWREDNVKNNAYLLLDPIQDAQGNMVPTGPIGFTKSPEVAPAVGALIALTKQDISDQLGNPENSEQMMPDQSGVALDLVQGRQDMQSYGYMDEAADAERRTAEIWLGMAAVIYDPQLEENQKRKLKVIAEDGSRGQVDLSRKIQDNLTGAPVNEIDFTKAQYDIITDIGPTSASRRVAVVRTVTQVMERTVDPELQTILGHLAIMNMEGEGMTGIREYSRKKLVAMGVEKPNKQDEAEAEAAKAAADQNPDPGTVLTLAMAQESEAKAAKLQADTVKAQADTALSIARTKEADANAQQTLAEIPIARQKAAVETSRAIMGELKDDDGESSAPKEG